MIEAGLQQEINYVMTQARNNRLEFVTVEHLLLALLNIDEVVTFYALSVLMLMSCVVS